MYEKLLDKYLQNSVTWQNVKEAYIAIRSELKSLGYSEETLERVDHISAELVKQQLIFGHELKQLRKEFKSIFGLDDHERVSVYLENKIKPINDLFPLNDVDNERRNTRDKNPERD
jgi:hypothetical protein